MVSEIIRYRQLGAGSYPMVAVRLTHMDREVEIEGIVDSGANYCIFHTSVAEELGIPWQRGRKISVFTVSEKVDIYLVKIHLQALSEPFECEVGFVKMGTIFNLLGRSGFFEKHQITFKETKKELILAETEIV